MKARKVIVTLELLTDARIADLKAADNWIIPSEVKQIQVNVVKDKK